MKLHRTLAAALTLVAGIALNAQNPHHMVAEKKRKTNLMKQGGRSLPEIKKKDQFDAVFYMKV